jgi:D-sedoheptulose 7-phosphate isomerase
VKAGEVEALMQRLIQQVLREHHDIVESIGTLGPRIRQAGHRMLECLEAGGTVWWIGNGGSAADCQHLAAELVGRFEGERRGLSSVALTTDSSILTSVSNDYGFERVFARQIEALCRPDDVLVAISTSGRSPNVIAGVETARAIGVYTVGLLGSDGGDVAGLLDCDIIVPSNSPARVQEAHILIGHLWCDYVNQHVARDRHSQEMLED